ncbi:hypothetical protein GNF10_23625 [Nostoc sp. UCD121]|uniref:Uncharacterized protein n=1 Tax=Nostoc flagelliforme FACHB-838 TaxID=2692904 RepID=A0ABR8DWT1_9NOSO|nr:MULTISPECIES: hypothetical protein [Nostoc]MBC1296175.1 hypothetical protein [Nostoc sp. UCD122]MBC1221287.1 hypothetical protein [Nostoc sp. UCD120]MBC1278873.1 hypothetical protein [Nostoc sp. UCD121]MBD2533613.1 hypothetical protein [Nostoc flagelliforme FACHB-838]MBN3877038.1 hypothetical protein [Nostoc sp. JL23]
MANLKKQRTFISFEIDPEIREAFSQQLKSEGRTVSAVLKQFIEDYLKSTEKPQDLTEVIKRLEEVERKVGIENNRLVGESAA